MLFSQTCLTADRTDFSSALRNASTSTRSRGFGLLVLVFTLSPQWCRGAGVPRGRRSVGWSTRLEIPARDDAEREGPLDELRALLVLREILDVELLEEAAQVGLDGIDAEEDLSGDLQVGGRGRVGRLLLVRPAQRRQDLPWVADSDATVMNSSCTVVSCEVLPRTSLKLNDVSPRTNVSPSRSGRRPVTRSPLRKVPLRDSPSSTTVQLWPTRSSWAWRRETFSSQGRRTSQPEPRPMVRDERVSRATTCS